MLMIWVVTWVSDPANNSQVHYGLLYWRKQESELRQLRKTKLSFRGNKARWPELEDRVEQLVVLQRTTGRGVSTVTIRQKAKAIAEEMDMEHFQGGRPWCFRFMRRQYLSIRARTTLAQRLPVDYQEKVAIFRTYCRDKITAPSHIKEAAEGKLCHHMRVDCRRMGYDTDFMYCKSLHKSQHQH
ncbi:hypothetical protein D4764_01G0015100 [Takifugu flavidus]|uniref:HTH CENPB-type domain-containing protein n=1 Tax=Takifugu flavidus TaxID=433684 RepID=A0A5C6PQE8_9TELE|nr:hypothetical protein D4764_01G0015100 [Takifugu flavidus]